MTFSWVYVAVVETLRKLWTDAVEETSVNDAHNSLTYLGCRLIGCLSLLLSLL
jgi:hypothetical protein